MPDLDPRQQQRSHTRSLEAIQSELSGPERALSRFIHLRVISRAAEVLGATLLRPRALLFGAVAASILPLAAYIIAKQYGYTFSGFESIAAFAGGWALGNSYDYLRLLFTGKKY